MRIEAGNLIESVLQILCGRLAPQNSGEKAEYSRVLHEERLLSRSYRVVRDGLRPYRAVLP